MGPIHSKHKEHYDIIISELWYIFVSQVHKDFNRAIYSVRVMESL